MFTHELAPLSPDLKVMKVFGMCWRRLYRVLDSCFVNSRSWATID